MNIADIEPDYPDFVTPDDVYIEDENSEDDRHWHAQNAAYEAERRQYDRETRYPRKQEHKLHRAIRKNNIDGVRDALVNGVHPDGENNAYYPSPISQCIRYERLAILRLLFKYNVRSPQLNTAWNGFEDELLLAAEKGNLEIFKALIGYRENVRGYRGFIPGYFDQAEPIHAAARGKRVPGCIGWLLERGANVNEEIKHWLTPLHFAVDREHARVDVVRYLLSNGADVDHENWDGNMPILIAAGRGNNKVVRELLRWKPRLDGKPEGNQWKLEHLHIEWDWVSVLHVAAEHCLLRTVRALVAAGADVYARDKEGKSILEFARRGRKMETVQWIVGNTELETLVTEPL
ncbi:ankyrin repeat-containing domain protein [Aspergillus multicolor]|uniref:ankyrin repeat domain-containing protein n=1 Tax=Aspergillus multicolor TaxID=41759 RepID=UPI003CCE36C0